MINDWGGVQSVSLLKLDPSAPEAKAGQASEGPNELPIAFTDPVELTLTIVPYASANSARYPCTNALAVWTTRDLLMGLAYWFAQT